MIHPTNKNSLATPPDATAAHLVKRYRYHETLLSALSPVVAALTAEVRGGGRNSRGHRLDGLQERLDAIPGTLMLVARWAESERPK